MKTARIGEIALVFNGDSTSTTEKGKHFRGAQGMPYVGTAEVGFDAEINYDAGICIPAAQLPAFKVAQAGAALVCAEGGSAGRKVGFLDRDVCFGNKLFAMQPKAGWDGKFLFYFSQSEEFREQFRALTTGLIGGVSVKKFKRIEVPDVSYDDQRRIVAVLDEAFAAIATATGNAEKNLANARELEGSVVYEALRNLPTGTQLAALETFCEAGRITTYGVIKLGDHVVDGVPCLRTSNVRWLEFELDGIKFIKPSLSQSPCRI